MKLKTILACSLLIAAGSLAADSTPVMGSLFTPVQAPSSDYDVTGVRLSLIYGDCQNFKGLDLGLVNHADGEFSGLAIGGANIADGSFCGAQVGLVNWNGYHSEDWAGRSIGVQLGALNYTDSFCGLQDGLVNVSGSSFSGLQAGLVNYADDMYGVQCGAYFILGVNIAGGSVYGCQLGLVNYAGTMERGLQIGIVNIIARNGWLPVLPIINGNF